MFDRQKEEKMRLIDASEYDLKSGEINWVEHNKCSISICRKPIYEIPTIQAIPVDKLCELLQMGKEKPYCEICNEIMPEWCNQHNKQPMGWDVEFDCPTWKQLLTEWIKHDFKFSTPHGKWLNMKDGNANCSVCGRRVIDVYDDDNVDRYCRNCGAKMDVEE